MSRPLTFLEEMERDASVVLPSDRPEPLFLMRRLASPRCRICWGVKGNHAGNCPEGDA